MFSWVVVFKYLFTILVAGLCTINANAQACILDIGSNNIESITSIFQLNKEQLTALDDLKLALKEERDAQELEVKNLLENHPQSTQDELLILAKKHKEIEERMFETTIKYDQKLISLFNAKQYERYILLCNSANRAPIPILEE